MDPSSTVTGSGETGPRPSTGTTDPTHLLPRQPGLDRHRTQISLLGRQDHFLRRPLVTGPTNRGPDRSVGTTEVEP